ncbi:helix-turn-helix transcriptional regulator [Pseudomonas shirazica]|uniref:helix-turn-helix domain-containing protein n=1 Tax=Pseudomonas shirazica TaxID=1940636 RepID=UPI0025A96832|nr:helix-turn-helix transcriptional regulator [Pseudomonas shirazica]MDM9599762.1 helix-turn-helix transcriptional regulator [Pseudomonas shirazica]MDO2413190.1 helix-turn-helix transcriptional regulator [Pseudomonas shirazica]
MTLKASFASVLRALRSKRNITQRDFADTTSRTYLSKLELGKSSITLDKLEQVSERLGLSPLTLLTLTLVEDTGKPVSDLISKLHSELSELQHDGGLSGLTFSRGGAHDTFAPATQRKPRTAATSSLQTELAFMD